MAKGLGNQIGLKTGTSLRIDPRVILGAQMLQCSQLELEQTLESELAENPALERVEQGEAAPTRDEILKSLAPVELRPSGGDNELWRSLPHDGEDSDWTDFAGASDSLADHLRAQMFSSFPGSPTVVEYLVGSVNDRGYLSVTPDEVAMDCGCSLDEAEEAVRALKQCEPPGVGASNLQECLVLQLRTAETDAERLARRVLQDDWELLVQRDLHAIRRRYRTTVERVKEAFEVVLGLNPFPGEGFRPHPMPGSSRPAAARADLVLARDEFGWSIEVPGPSPLTLRLNRSYEKRHTELAGNRRPSDEKRHVTEYVQRAKQFIDALGQRRRLMGELGRYLVEHQPGFLATGDVKFLTPMTRALLAASLGVHESTVSRATSGKFVQIATGEVLAFDVFFKPALRVQKMIEEILSTENPGRPLSDEAIAKLLKDRGVDVARRTVNKYRDRTKLLSSRRRKSA